MAKKTRKARRKPDAPPPSAEGSWVLPLLGGALAGALLTYVATRPIHAEAPEPDGPPLATKPILGDDDGLTDMQRQGFARLKQQILADVQGLPGSDDQIPAEDEDRRFVVRHPEKPVWLMALGRARPAERDKWTVAVVDTEAEAGLGVRASYELPGANGIETAAFNAFGSVAILLTRKDSRARPPGDLYRIVPGENRATKVDEGVFKFTVSGDGDALVYERALDPEVPLGARELKIFHASREQSQVVASYEYPKEQVGQLGPWGPGDVFLEVKVDRYGETFGPPKTSSYTLDPFNPENFSLTDGEDEGGGSEGDDDGEAPPAPAPSEG